MLAKLQVFDKQIEQREEFEKMKQTLESNEIVQRTIKEQLSSLNQKVFSENEDGLRHQKIKMEIAGFNFEQRILTLETQVKNIYSKSIVTENTIGANISEPSSNPLTPMKAIQI